MPYADPTLRRTRSIWRNMIRRCYDPKNISYPNYGAKGIMVCARWKESFQAFLEDVGPIPKPLTIDRLRNSDHYRPGNVRIATVRQQNNNKSDTTEIAYGGKTQTMTAWAAELGMSVQALFYRLRAGWPMETVMTRALNHANPVIQVRRKNAKLITIDGETKQLCEWLSVSGMKESTVHNRLRRGWDYKSAFFGQPKWGRNRRYENV